MVKLKRSETSKVPLLDYFRKRKSDEDEKPKDDTPELPKASIRQLWRYAQGFDLFMVVLGAIVALITGAGMPAMTIVLGSISQSFVKANILLYDPSYMVNTSAGLVPFNATYSFDDFRSEMIQNCVIYVIIGVVIFIAAFTQVMCFLVSGENMIHRMRKAFFRAILRQDIPYFDKTATGTLTTKIFDNLERVKEGTGDKVGLALQFISQFLSGFIIAFAYNWKLTLIMMSLTPFLVVCGWFMSRIMARAAAREMKKYAKAGAVAEEALSSIRTVVAFNGQERECSRYDKALAAAKIDGIMKSIWVGFGLAMTFLIMFASYCLAFWLGTDYVADGSMNASNILTAFFSVVMGSMALGQAGQQFAVIGTAQGAAAAILDIIDRVPDIDSYSTEGERPRDVKGHIVLKDVHFTYPTRADIPVLRGITLEALPGETVALVGASGCGKSTITQLLLRYYNPMSGQIAIDGHDISSLNIEYLRKLIGVVSQEPVLFNCTIEENILYGNPDVTPSQMTAACRMANAENFISQLPQGYKTIVGERGTQLSGGQKQRIAIARALVRDPKILLLDEATSALDAESESIVQAALDKAAQGRTTIVIAHRLSTIKNASKIIAIKDGAIAEVGTHEELLAKQGLYHELVNAQVFTDLGDAKADYGRQTSVLSARSRRSSTSSRDGLKRTLSHETEEDSDSDDSLPAAGQQEDIKSATKRLKRDLEKEGAKAENLLTIVKHARPEWGYLILAILSSLIGGGVFPAFSQFFTEIIRVFSETDKDKMRRDGHMWALMFLVLGIVQGICFFTQVFFFGLSSERFTMRLRSRLFRNIMRMDIAYFDMPNHSTGKITTRLASDTPNVRSALDYRLGSVFSCVVSVSAGLGLAFYYGWQLALLLVAIFPLLGVGHGLQMKYLRGRLEKDKRETENAGKLALEAIENIRTVQALTLEKKFYQMFSDNLEEPHRTSTRKAMMQAVSYGFSNSIPYFLYAAAFRFGLFLILDKILLPMNVLKVLFAISFTSGSLGFASAYFPEYSKARLAAGIIFKMLAEHPKIDSMMKGGKMKAIRGSVTLRNILFSYPERPSVRVLKGLDLNVEPGQTLALVGPSGCGKSTVVSLLERFYDPSGGNVLIDDDDLREYNVGHVRSHMALVSQEPILFDCSIRENITYGLDPSAIPEESIEKATQLANIHKFIGELPQGLDTRVGEKGTQLSGGQKQRIAIARALIRNPKILLLDEATSALDTESEKVVQEALDRASQGRTCIVIAHRLSTIVNADLIAVVKDGVVIEKGTHPELIARRGAYFDLTQKQSMKKT